MTDGPSAPRQRRGYESASSVATYHACGEQYRRRYLLGEKDGDNLPAVAGSILHDLMDEDAKGAAYPDFTAEAKRRLRAVEGLEALPYWGRQNAEWWFREGFQIRTDNYLQVRSDEVRRGVTVVASEVELTVPLADDIPPLRLFIDRVHDDSQGRRVVLDWKTGKRKPRDLMQVELYRVAYNVAHPDRPADYAVLCYLGDKKGPVFVVVPATIGRGEAAAVVRQVATAETFPFSGPYTESCGVCPFRPDCLVGQVGERSML